MKKVGKVENQSIRMVHKKVNDSHNPGIGALTGGNENVPHSAPPYLSSFLDKPQYFSTLEPMIHKKTSMGAPPKLVAPPNIPSPVVPQPSTKRQIESNVL